MTLYRTHRPQRFTDIVGQDPIVTTLRNAVASDRVAHAYLFVGPRGTGKTSTARVLAKAINCMDRAPDGEPCDACRACTAIRNGSAMDVLEIDAASNGSVDDARELVTRAHTSTFDMARRVYIIDEVHMLSKPAFNALLKLIEEPPAHVVFILATTETHKIPATVISRTQRHNFRPMSVATMAAKLARIAEAEGVTAEPEALKLVARMSDGAMRDAESLFEQVMTYSRTPTVADVQAVTGIAPSSTVAGFVDAIERDRVGDALMAIRDLSDEGRDLAQVARQASALIRWRMYRHASNPDKARRYATMLHAVSKAAHAARGQVRVHLELAAVGA